MAKTMSGIESLGDSPSLALLLRAVWVQRLALGFIVLLGSILFFLGTSWDIQWHIFVGRDRTLIPPHQMMLTGVALSGIAALAAVIIETVWIRHNALLARYTTSFAESFHGSLGAYIAGFAALNAAVAFPLDAYWHALYGIDVAIWAPFHVMFVMGMAIVALGAAYMLVSAARLAARAGAIVAKRVAYVSVIVALATALSNLTILLFDAMGDRGFIDLHIMTINLFPVLSGIVVGLILVTAVYAVPWRWAASSVVGVYLAFSGIVAAFVPPAMYWLVALERLSFRPNQDGDPGLAAVSLRWPVGVIITAILIDVFMRRAQQKEWSPRKLTIVLVVVTLLGSLPMPVILPLLPVFLANMMGIPSFIASLLVGLLGGFIGVWFGRNVGESMGSLER
jgi:hypothetical protein